MAQQIDTQPPSKRTRIDITNSSLSSVTSDPVSDENNVSPSHDASIPIPSVSTDSPHLITILPSELNDALQRITSLETELHQSRVKYMELEHNIKRDITIQKKEDEEHIKQKEMEIKMKCEAKYAELYTQHTTLSNQYQQQQQQHIQTLMQQITLLQNHEHTPDVTKTASSTSSWPSCSSYHTRAAHDHAQKQLRNAYPTIKQQQQQIQHMAFEITSMHTSHHHIHTQYDSQISDAKEQRDIAMKYMTKAEGEKQILVKEMEQLKTTITTMTHEMNTWKEKYDDIKKEYDIVIKEMSRLKMERNDILDEIKHVKKERDAILHRTSYQYTHDLESKITTLKQQIQEHTTHISQLEKECQTQQQQISQIKNEKDAIMEKDASINDQHLKQQQLSALQASYASLQLHLSTVTSRIPTLTSELATAHETIKHQQSQLTSHEHDKQYFIQSYVQWQQEKLQLQQQITRLDDVIGNMGEIMERNGLCEIQEAQTQE